VQKQQNDTIEFMDGARAIDDPLGGQILAASEHVVHFYYGSVNDKDPFRLYKRQEYDTSQTIKDVRIVLGFNEYVL
ncbi:hypothetical protein OFN55_43140, partial [Escherichia coli]|nr:hypothetical protein [Escherichia coli]